MSSDSLMQYIKDKNGRKCGIISAFKMDSDKFNNWFCNNEKYKKNKSFVMIIHSKARPGVDKYDFERGMNIIMEKYVFMIDILTGKKQKREKFVDEIPSKQILKYYKDMKERARRYFKDCDEIICYYEMFEYTKTNEELDSYVSKLEDLIKKIDSDNPAINFNSAIIEQLSQQVQ